MSRSITWPLLFCAAFSFLTGCGSSNPSAQDPPLAPAPPMPIPIDQSRNANTRWLNKTVLNSRLLDNMENLSTWTHQGPGQMALTTDRFRDGQKSLRLSSPTTIDNPNTKSGRPSGESVLHHAFPGEDWASFNRVSVWVYPTMPGHKFASLVLKFSNDGAEKHPLPFTRGSMHYALVTPGQWNHIVWEIDHLSRDKVTALDLFYRLQGNQSTASNNVSFDFDQLELQRVTPDYHEGWPVAPAHIAFSHTGYELHCPKTAFASDLKTDHFELINSKTNKTVLTKPLRTLTNPLGTFQILEFSEIAAPGDYFLRAGDITTPSFRIDTNIWRNTVWETINFFYCERCGDNIPGIHDICHADWQAEHNGKRIVINGGWHDAGDLSQGLINTAEAAHAMFTLAERLRDRDPQLSIRLIEEAQWGLAWLHKTRFGDGFRVFWATMDYWTDNKIGTPDDTFANNVTNGPTDNAVGSSASAIAARVLKSTNPTLAAQCLQIAREDWQFAIAKLNNPNVETLGAVILASIELYKTTAEQPYADKAAEIAKLLVASQQKTYTDWPIPMAGFFYSSPRRDRILNYLHRGHDQAAVVALVDLCNALPNHPDWMEWYSSVALYSDFLQTASRFQEPYSLLPAGIYKLADNPAQVSKGLKLSETYYLRRFPVWSTFRGHYGILLSQTKALAAAAQLRNRRELADLCQSQLQWVVGRNPFAQSTMFGQGYDYAPQYTALSGDIVGSLPVGIQTKLNEDTPYWPVTNCWNYKEVWVHPSSRWLFIMADLMTPPRDSNHITFTLTQKPAHDGQITIAARVRGTGNHTLTLRPHNLQITTPTQALDLQSQYPQTLIWTAKLKAPTSPWIAVIYPDDDLSRKRDLTSQHPTQVTNNK
ncbi:MAG: glycoside hydrolase family 9 protein [Planctomycetota bacterium]|nr:glycoside hydrolase family 9 protein [Planctomycetota bacterium]